VRGYVSTWRVLYQSTGWPRTTSHIIPDSVFSLLRKNMRAITGKEGHTTRSSVDASVGHEAGSVR
jgi:hypothetical protein